MIIENEKCQVIKAKKRRLGRAQKTIGDYCLLAGSPVDANAHYSTAMELARLTGDFFWYAGAMEGSVCALLVRMNYITLLVFSVVLLEFILLLLFSFFFCVCYTPMLFQGYDSILLHMVVPFSPKF